MARVQPQQYAPPRNNEEFDDGMPDVYPPPPEQSEEQDNGQAETVRRRRSPLERSIAGLLRAPDNATPEDLIRQVEAVFKEYQTLREDFGRQATVTERTTAYNDVLKKKLKSLKHKLVEIALGTDDD